MDTVPTAAIILTAAIVLTVDTVLTAAVTIPPAILEEGEIQLGETFSSFQAQSSLLLEVRSAPKLAVS